MVIKKFVFTLHCFSTKRENPVSKTVLFRKLEESYNISNETPTLFFNKNIFNVYITCAKKCFDLNRKAFCFTADIFMEIIDLHSATKAFRCNLFTSSTNENHNKKSWGMVYSIYQTSCIKSK